MKEIKIEHLAYLLKHAKENKEPQPIFFLGAGASRTGNIPLASEIINKISADFGDSPFFKDLKPELRTYATLMECLLPAQRDKLLKDYIKEAKINVTHIYLAQLLHEGYVDYILTVNFDNLMLRALALYNIFPPTYDMAILTDLTTTTFKEKSVVYLHGQNHGLWLLNTPEEMDKVRTIVPRIFDSIKNGRPWIFIGYSAEDPIFEHIKNLGRFDNGLYWVAYNDHMPSEKVLNFISGSNTNASLIKGYDSDSFMLKLNSELGLNQPSIVDRPFTALQQMLSEIVDINDEDHFKGVKERLEISKRQVDEAIQQYEHGINTSLEMKQLTEIDLLKKEIINIIIDENFNSDIIKDIERKSAAISDLSFKYLFSGLFVEWGNNLATKAKNATEKASDELFSQAFSKYKRAVEINPNMHEAYYNWGTAIANMAKGKDFKDANELYNEVFDKYEKAREIEPNKAALYNNWGIYLGDMAMLKEKTEAEVLYSKAFEMYQKAIDLDSKDNEVYSNWGLDLVKLGNLLEGDDADKLHLEALDKFKRSIEIKPDGGVYNNWAALLGTLAQNETDPPKAQILYNEAFEKYRKASELNPDDGQVYNNWGTHLFKFANSSNEDLKSSLYQEALKKFDRAVELGGTQYNIACLYALLGEQHKALYYLEQSLIKKEISISFIENDNDWAKFSKNEKFRNLLLQYKDNPISHAELNRFEFNRKMYSN